MKRAAGNARRWTSASALRGVGRSVLAGLMAIAMCFPPIGQTTAAPGERALRLFNIHTKERAEIVFWRNGRFDQQGLRKINQFLRDWRRDEPTKMDPNLINLVWDVYRKSGSRDYIHVVSAFRSPATNDALRRRSKGVAKNSMHTKGRAMDFYLPDVKLSKLRALGFTMQWGGVGYYPKSGAPFVHLDTGNVRSWPRMSRKELVKLFPDGKTLHVPTDGKPLSGYAIAKAADQRRRASRETAVAGLFPEQGEAIATRASGAPIVVASAPEKPAEPAVRPIAVAIGTYASPLVPTPRLAPQRPRQPTVIAAAPPQPAPAQVVAPQPTRAASVTSSPLPLPSSTPTSLQPAFDFGRSQDWAAPAVPVALAAAMAERDQTRRGSSLPIAPTSVVATIDVNRPLRAQAITTAVLRDGVQPAQARVLGYAPAQAPDEAGLQTGSIGGIPAPRANPMRRIASISGPATRSVVPTQHFAPTSFTLTTLDTHALKSWVGPGSTRQRAFATLTMPDIRRGGDLTGAPQYGYANGFGPRAYPDLRTDRFTGPLGRPPAIIMLASR